MFDNYNYDKLADRHSFIIEGVDLAIVNSIRRILLSEIPVIGFYGEEEPTIEVIFNNGPLHNEFMIHRLGLIPICVSEKIIDDYNDGDYIIELNVSNKSSETINITTDNFTGTYKGKNLTKDELNQLFPPPNKNIKKPILITRLRSGEQFHAKATAIKRTGKLNASFSCVSLANFFFVQDEKEAKTKDNVLDKERSYLKDIYGEPQKINFQIESINNFSYRYLFHKAILIIKEKLENLILKLTNKEIEIEEVPNCNGYSYNFHIHNEDDTLGNLIQSLIHNKHIRTNSNDCTYIGYICPHPLIDKLVIRLTLNTTNIDAFSAFLISNIKDITKIMDNIEAKWLSFAIK
jgi:DNA-directed RNA polymerase subunit L